ncbi:LysR substrate-binding domain-containing protein [Sphingomonas canadensis]|uniref:LysR substrate-binding domain-containing protein n=1 Tax=Sphingomonas canadensis TaxID=1219257 RepID=A0ABW3HB94_9SPHN|nr:LysR substrate-binding domain-containing protein [Sphingomonas canadensis]MCW3838451.1 LysR substrate-binding domain-containing protein [Sphingomonas canadensis]
MRRIPPLAAVRVFEAAARLGSFTRAAEELGMTQAAVSYQMKLLEERLGVPLFARSGRGIVLTDIGRRIAPQITSAFDLMGDAFASLRQENEAVLTVSAPMTFATNWLAARLGGFQVARPELAVRLDTSDIKVDFSTGEFDAAVRGTVHPGDALVSHFLMRMPVAPLASPEFLARHRPIREPADLLEVPRLSPDDDWWELWFSTAMGGVVPDRQGGVRMDWQVQQGNAAIAGHGVAALSPPMWQHALASGQLVQVLPHFVQYRSSFWLVYPESKRHLSKVRAFRDWILAEVRGAMGDDPFGALIPPSAEELAR